MTDIVEFLFERIAEDEKVARAAAVPPRTHDEGPHRSVAQVDSTEDGAFIDHFGPPRVLAECDAKRALIALHDSGPSELLPGVRVCPSCGGESGQGLVSPNGCPTLRALALPYAGHADYQSEWHPS